MTAHHIHETKRSENRAYSSSQQNLLIVLFINAVVMIAEIIGGFLANSLALLSDAGHMLTDVLAIGMSVVAMRFAQKPPTASKTFGFYRLEIIAAFFNGILLFFINDLLTSRSVSIIKEIERLLKEKYNIEHSTIQFENESFGDGLVQDSVPG